MIAIFFFVSGGGGGYTTLNILKPTVLYLSKVGIKSIF